MIENDKVLISLENGQPVATPATITVKSGHDFEFEATGGLQAFQLDFHESPEAGGKELFDWKAGDPKIKIKAKQVDKKKYSATAPKRIKFDVVIGEKRLDPDVIIDPN